MESQDQVLASDKLLPENEGIGLKIKISSATLSFEHGRGDPGSGAEHLEEIKYASDRAGGAPKNDKNISSTESGNFIAEFKSEDARVESKNVSIEKEQSSCQLTESSNISAIKETPEIKQIGNVSQQKDLSSQVICSEALAGVAKLETTSNQSSSSSSFGDKALSDANRMASSGNLTQQSSDEENVLKYTREAIQTLNLGTEVKSSHRSLEDQEEHGSTIVYSTRLHADVIREVIGSQNVFESTLIASNASNTSFEGKVLSVESLRSICAREIDTESGHLEIDACSKNVKKETNTNEKPVSLDELQPFTRTSETAGNKSVITKKSDCVEANAVKSTTNNSTTKSTGDGNILDVKANITTETTCDENVICKNPGATTENNGGENDGDSVDTSKSVGGENVTKEHSNIATKLEKLLDQDENVANEQITTKFATGDLLRNETTDEDASETVPQPVETIDDNERTAFFYMSSCSVPGMDKEWEWPSVSSSYHYQRPPRRMERRRNTYEPRNCLGTQRCHYIILAVGVLGAIFGCLTYHLQDYGIGPKVLRPIGASAAFLSFVVCAFSSVYLTYLSYYTQGRSPYNYQPVNVSDPVASMFIETMPQGYNSDPRFYFTSSAAATAQQVFRETQSADALDRFGYSWHQTEIKRPFDEPGPSGYDPDSKRFKMDPARNEGEVYEMRSMKGDSEKDRCKERNLSQASDSSYYSLADHVHHSNNGGEIESTENTPLLPKK